jgi:hypothetical protein
MHDLKVDHVLIWRFNNMAYEYGSKRQAVLDALQNKPMSVHDLHEKFRPDITYAYLRTMLYKLHATGEVEVCGTGQLTISPNGGHREYFIYRRVGSEAEVSAETQVRSKKVFKVGYRYPKKVGMKPQGSRGRPRNKVLTDKDMSADERRRLMIETIPLFQLYFNAPLDRL